MNIKGKQLQYWQAYLHAWQDLNMLDSKQSIGFIPTYDSRTQTLLKSQNSTSAYAQTIRDKLQEYEFGFVVNGRPADFEKVNCDYSIASMNTEKIAPSPLEDEEIETLKYSLRKAAYDLHEVVVTLRTPIAAADFPDSIKKAIRQHQQDCYNPIEEISQRLREGSIENLSLFDVLKLNLWHRTGSKEAVVYNVLGIDTLEQWAKIMTLLADRMEQGAVHDNVSLKEMFHAARNFVCTEFMLGCAIFLTDSYGLEGQLAEAGNKARRALDKISQDLNPQSAKIKINDFTLSAIYDQCKSTMEKNTPPLYLGEDWAGAVFKIHTAKSSAGVDYYVIGAEVPEKNIAAILALAKRYSGYTFKEVPSETPGKRGCVLADFHKHTQRFETIEQAAQTLRDLSRKCELPIDTMHTAHHITANKQQR